MILLSGQKFPSESDEVPEEYEKEKYDGKLMKTTTLQQLIVEHIRESGPMTFADYMQMALYEPGYGYYVTGPARMGWEGDYYTSTDLSPLFAHCIGRQLELMWEELGRPARLVVLEQGAGRGDLARQIQIWTEQKRSALAQALTYETADCYDYDWVSHAKTKDFEYKRLGHIKPLLTEFLIIREGNLLIFWLP
jgi:hypothetical protein